jgi:hypothetical protein
MTYRGGIDVDAGVFAALLASVATRAAALSLSLSSEQQRFI